MILTRYRHPPTMMQIACEWFEKHPNGCER